MSTLDSLYGWDAYIVNKAMKALRLASTPEKRRAVLIKVEAENPPEGARVAALAEACFREEFAQRKAQEVARA